MVSTARDVASAALPVYNPAEVRKARRTQVSGQVRWMFFSPVQRSSTHKMVNVEVASTVSASILIVEIGFVMLCSSFIAFLFQWTPSV